VTVRRVSVSVDAGQFVPLARHTEVPPTVRLEVRFKLVPVPFVKTSVVRFESPATPRFVLVVLVPVAFVHVRFVKLDGEKPFTVRLVMLAFVANRLVEVEFVEVVFAKYPFHRSEDDPRFCAASDRGLRLVETPPMTARYVEVV
jgi:hypothetical protein